MADLGLAWQPCEFDVTADTRADGSILLRPAARLSRYPDRITDKLEHWAQQAPDRVFVGQRDAVGDWQTVSYRDALEQVRKLGAGLAGLQLGPEKPLLILSGNSIEHLLLGLAAMYVGVPYCPVSPAYSAAGSGLSKLRYVVDLLTPGLVASFRDDSHSRAIERAIPSETPVVCDADPDSPHRFVTMAELRAGEATAAERRHAGVSGDTIAKFLLTSGSTGHPKPVVTTHRMLCSNQVMLHQAVPFVVDEPPILVDWLPWNHTFGGSHNVGLAFFNGGTLYIDDGRPVAGAFDETVRNLREVSPTVFFNVPKGYELLAAHLERDDALRHSFYRRLRACFFAGASLAQHTWDQLDTIARRERGNSVPMISGLGCTEASPSITFTTPGTTRAGVIGLPATGNEVKLTPTAGKLELRVRGPNVTPGYWRLPDETAKAFDEEGYYRLGDAVRLVDPEDATRGMVFDGRIAEDFKLASGTWVSTGPLRLSLLGALAPLAKDVVIAGLNRDYVAVLIVPDVAACESLSDPQDDTATGEVLRSRILRDRLIRSLRRHAGENPGSSRHAERAIVLTEPLSIDRGEITDKGTVNQRAVLNVREALIADLYADAPPEYVLVVTDRT